MKKPFLLAALIASAALFVACSRDKDDVTKNVPAKASVSGAEANTCPANTVVLTARATDATSFVWYNGSEKINGAIDNTYEVSVTGTYYAVGVNDLGEGAKSEAKTVAIIPCSSNITLLNLNAETTTLSEWDIFLKEFKVIDSDGDGITWKYWWHDDAHTKHVFGSESRDRNTQAPLTPENYLLLPPLSIGTNGKFTFIAQAGSSNSPREKFKVIISDIRMTTGVFARGATVLHTHTLTDTNPYTQTLDIPASYNGSTVYLGIAHFECAAQDILWIPQLKVEHQNASGVAPPPSYSESSEVKSIPLNAGKQVKIIRE
jgi:hypothetical protein